MGLVQRCGVAVAAHRRPVESPVGDLRRPVETSPGCSHVRADRVPGSHVVPVVVPYVVVTIVAVYAALGASSPVDPAAAIVLAFATVILATGWVPGVCRQWISSHVRPMTRVSDLEADDSLLVVDRRYTDNSRFGVSTMATAGRSRLSARPAPYGALEASLVGACTAAVIASLAWQNPPAWQLVVDGTFAFALVPLCIVDVSVHRIPSSMLSAAASVVGALMLARIVATGTWAPLLGGWTAATGAGAVLGVARCASGGGLGRGDVRLATLIGFVLGWHAWTPAHGVPGSLVAAWAAVIVAGALAAVSHMLIKATGATRPVLPFAPALSAGAIVVLLLT